MVFEITRLLIHGFASAPLLNAVREQIKAQIKAVLVMSCISRVNSSIDF